jgi:hypothetical protein
MSRQTDIPKQVRVRTDPDAGLGHRYETIEYAKDALNEGNKTDTILAACDHAQQDIKAKREALEYLAEHVPMKHVEEVADLLSTSQMRATTDVGTYVTTE